MSAKSIYSLMSPLGVVCGLGHTLKQSFSSSKPTPVRPTESAAPTEPGSVVEQATPITPASGLHSEPGWNASQQHL